MFEVGQSVEVKVLKFDPDSQRVSLGYKQIRPDPWEEAEYKYPVGAIVRGKVVSIPDYGAFVELEDGIEGLVHISEMTWNKRVKHPSKLVNVGDTIEAKVLGMDVENKRISLGMKQLEANPWDLVEQQYPVGSHREGQGPEHHRLRHLRRHRRGHRRPRAHLRPVLGPAHPHPSDKFKKGDDVEARVLSIDKDRALLLGIKQLTEDPWYTVQSRYFLGQVVEGPVVHAATSASSSRSRRASRASSTCPSSPAEATTWQESVPGRQARSRPRSSTSTATTADLAVRARRHRAVGRRHRGLHAEPERRLGAPRRRGAWATARPQAVLQNADQVVQLRLDLTSRVGAWEMREPVQATALMLGAFAAGAVAAGLPLMVWGLRRRPAYTDFNS
jgi:predicted RNA-binding protein with RPS1 domain